MKKSIFNIFRGDKVVWMVFLILSLISVIEVFSASSSLTYKGGNYWSPLVKHGATLLMGFVFMMALSYTKCKYFKLVTPFLILASYMMLFWVLVAGHSTNDAARWVSLFGVQFQPSEVAKGTMVLATAQILAATQTDKGADSHAFKWILVICFPMIALIVPENFSTAALMVVTLLMMMFIGRVPVRQVGSLFSILAIFVVVAGASVLLIGDTKDADEQRARHDTALVADGSVPEKKDEGLGGKIFHRASLWKKRILAHVDTRDIPPDSVDLRDNGAQVAFSKIAIASSGGTGVGPGNSEIRDFLPQAFSDFIFSIIIEEMGVFGLVLVPFLYFILLFRAGVIARRCANNFPAFLVMGLALMLVTQALVNMCVAVGIAPVTGQPLPLVSKGGTSVVINCVYIGVILSVSSSAKKRTE